MKTITPDEIPSDYHYYRSWFSIYFDYKKKYLQWGFLFNRIKGVFIWKKGFFWWIDTILFWCFFIADFLKTPLPPTLSELRQKWMKHGIVVWSPWWNNTRSLEWWRKVPFFLKKWYHHSNRSSFSVLDETPYVKKLSWNARNHLKHIQKNIENWKITIREVDIDTWISIYKKTKLPHKFKRQHSNTIARLEHIHKDNLRIVLAFVDGVPLAGSVFLDEKPTSVYFVAFQDIAAKQYHLWLAIIDWWFNDSTGKWFKYLDFDHMWAPWDPKSYKWYTQFKSELADFDVYFKEIWYRIF